MEYYTIQKGGSRSSITRVKSGRKTRVSEATLSKAMKRGGGMMFDPKEGKVLMWPGMWSPSDVGNPDCGQPVVTKIIKPEEPIRAAIAEALKPVVSIKPPPLQVELEKTQKETTERLKSVKAELAALEKQPGLSAGPLMKAREALKQYESLKSKLETTKNKAELDELAKQLAERFQTIRVSFAQLKPIPPKPPVTKLEVPVPKKVRDLCEAKLLEKGYKTGTYISRGEYGTVTELCKNTDCKYVLKIQPWKPGEITGYEREVENLLKLKKLDPAGKVVAPMIDSWNCELIDETKEKLIAAGLNKEMVNDSTKLGYIIMDRFDGTISDLKLTLEDSKKILELMDQLHDLGFVHYDPKTVNILYRGKAPNRQFRFGDMGRAWYYKDSTDQRLILNMLAVDYLMLVQEIATDYQPIQVEFEKRFIDLVKKGWDYKDTDLDYMGNSQFWNQPAISFGEFAKLEIPTIKLESYYNSKKEQLMKLDAKTRKLVKFEKDVPSIKKQIAEISSLQGILKGLIQIIATRQFQVPEKIAEARKVIDDNLSKWDALNKQMEQDIGVGLEKKKKTIEAEAKAKQRERKVKAFFGIKDLPSQYRDACEQVLAEKHYKQGKFLAAGVFGAVSELCQGYEDCLDKKYNYVVKLQPFSDKDNELSTSGYKKEMAIAKIVAERAPDGDFYVKVVDNWSCDLIPAVKKTLQKADVQFAPQDNKLGMSVMERWDGNLYDLIKKNALTKEDIPKILEVLDKLHEIGVFHMDSHKGNFLYKGTGSARKFGITDFGAAWDFKSDVIDPDKETWTLRGDPRFKYRLSELANHLGFDYYMLQRHLERYANTVFDEEVYKEFRKRYQYLRRQYNWYILDHEDTIYNDGSWHRPFFGFADAAPRLAFTPEDEAQRMKYKKEMEEGIEPIAEEFNEYEPYKDILLESQELTDLINELERKINNIERDIHGMNQIYIPPAYKSMYNRTKANIAEGNELVRKINPLLTEAKQKLKSEIEGTRHALSSAITDINAEISTLKAQAKNKPDALKELQDLESDTFKPLAIQVNAVSFDFIKSLGPLTQIRTQLNNDISNLQGQLDEIKKKIAEEAPAVRERRASVEMGQSIQAEYGDTVTKLKEAKEQYNEYHQLPDAVGDLIIQLNAQVTDVDEKYQALIGEDTVKGVESLIGDFKAALAKAQETHAAVARNVAAYINTVLTTRKGQQLEALVRLKTSVEKFLKKKTIDEATRNKAQQLSRDIEATTKSVNETPSSPYKTMLDTLDKNDTKIVKLQKRRRRLLPIKLPAKQPDISVAQEGYKTLSAEVSEIEKMFTSKAKKLQNKINAFNQWRENKSINFVRANTLEQKAEQELSKIPEGIAMMKGMIKEASKSGPTLMDMVPVKQGRSYEIIGFQTSNEWIIARMHGNPIVITVKEISKDTYKITHALERISKEGKFTFKPREDLVGKTGEVTRKDIELQPYRTFIYIETEEEEPMILNLTTIREVIDEQFDEFREAIKNAKEYIVKMIEMKDEYLREEAEWEVKVKADFDELRNNFTKTTDTLKSKRSTIKSQRAQSLRSGKAIDWDAVNAEEVVEKLEPELGKLFSQFKGLGPNLKELIMYQEPNKGIKARVSKFFKSTPKFPTDFEKFRNIIKKDLQRALRIQTEILDASRKQALMEEYKKLLLETAVKLAELSAYKITPFWIKTLVEQQKSKRLSERIAEYKRKARTYMEQKIKDAGIAAQGTIRTLKAHRPSITEPGFFVPPVGIKPTVKPERIKEEVKFPLIKTQEDVPKLLKYLQDQNSILAGLRTKHMESSPPEVQQEIRERVNNIIASITQPGLYIQQGMLYKKIQPKKKLFAKEEPQPVTDNYLADLQKLLLNIKSNIVWIYNREELQKAFAPKTAEAIKKLSAFNPEAAKEITEESTKVANSINEFISLLQEERGGINEQAKDKEILKVILSQLGQQKVVANGILSTKQRNNAFAAINSYFHKLKRVPGNKVDEALQDIFYDLPVPESEFSKQALYFGLNDLSKFRDKCNEILALKRYKTGRILGKGNYGYVDELCQSYKECVKNNYKYVVKVQPYNAKQTTGGYLQEVKLNKLLLERAPRGDFYVKMIDNWDCELTNETRIAFKQKGINVERGQERVGMLVFERWDGDISSAFKNKKITTEDVRKILSLIDKLHEIGIVHLDNTAVNIFRKGDKFALGDFGIGWDTLNEWKPESSRFGQRVIHNINTHRAFDYWIVQRHLQHYDKKLFKDTLQDFNDRYKKIGFKEMKPNEFNIRLIPKWWDLGFYEFTPRGVKQYMDTYYAE